MGVVVHVVVGTRPPALRCRWYMPFIRHSKTSFSTSLWTANSTTVRQRTPVLRRRPSSTFDSSSLFSTAVSDATTKTTSTSTNNNDVDVHWTNQQHPFYHENDNGPITNRVLQQMKMGQLRYDLDQLMVARRLDELRTALQTTDGQVPPLLLYDDDETASSSLDLYDDTRPNNPLTKAQTWLGLGLKSIRETVFTMMGVPPPTPRGIYIYGSVGVGKSMLMDLFANDLIHNNNNNDNDCNTGETTRPCPNRNVRRVHFHEFMLDVHDRIHHAKQRHPQQDPLPRVALALAQEARILCLDEFQVTDIADAMILQRLFRLLWMDHARQYTQRHSWNRMVVIATSNRRPEALYEGGLNRSLFLPFIYTMKRHMDVIEMDGRQDYRRRQQEPPHCEDHSDDDNDNKDSVNDDSNTCDVPSNQTYFWPADSPATRKSLNAIFQYAADGSVRKNTDHNRHFPSNLSSLPSTESTTPVTTIPVRMGRYVTIPKSNQHCAWFNFMDLCGKPLGAADYLALCDRYSVLIVDTVPQLDGTLFNEARRFVTLIDAVYESQTQLVLACEVPLEDLLVHFDATVQTNDGDEEIAVEGVVQSAPTTSLTNKEQQSMIVKGEGGSSSSSSTTFLRNREGGEVEWSATGRIGVSLAQLSSVKEVSFSFQRAESRLFEMSQAGMGKAYQAMS